MFKDLSYPMYVEGAKVQVLQQAYFSHPDVAGPEANYFSAYIMLILQSEAIKLHKFKLHWNF